MRTQEAPVGSHSTKIVLSFGSIKIGPPPTARTDPNKKDTGAGAQTAKVGSSRSLSDDDDEEQEISEEEDRSSLVEEPLDESQAEAEKSSDEEIILSSNAGDPVLAGSPMLDPQQALQAGLDEAEEADEDDYVEDPCLLKRQKTSQPCSINSETSEKV